MNIIISILIFALVLFIYLHIYYHIKTSNDLEIYELSNLSKERLEEVCNLRQPISFYLDINCFDLLNINELEKSYNSFDIKLRDVSGNSSNELYLPIVFNKARTVIKKTYNYFSEHNQDFLIETGLIDILKLNDFFLRPPGLMISNYDYIMGAANVTTPLRHEISYRNFFLVLNGSITIKLTPPKNKKYLYPDYDYENFEFISLVNPWNVQNQYKSDFNKIKFLDVNLDKGKIIFIPAYWWYSIKINSSDTSIINFKYKTCMNNIAILPHYIKYFLQKHNIKHNIIKTAKNS